jgi:hypothetical protein
VSPGAQCPHPEEFSALLDRQLAPEEIPTLERHVGECEDCRKLFLRLSAADRMLGLVLGKVDLVQESLEVKPAKDDTPSDKLLDDLEAIGRAERVRVVRHREEKKAKRKSRRRLCFSLFVLLLIGGFAGALQPSPVVDLGGARKEGVWVLGPGDVVLHRKTKLRLSDDARVRFTCAFRWDRPVADLEAGKLTVLEGKLLIKVKNEVQEMDTNQSGTIGPDGVLKCANETPTQPPPEAVPDGKPESGP